MERYEGPIVPGQADTPGDDQERPLPLCPVCWALMRRTVALDGTRPLACGLHGVHPPHWTTAREIEDDREPNGVRYLGGGRWGATS